jgi:hypothetical protein
MTFDQRTCLLVAIPFVERMVAIGLAVDLAAGFRIVALGWGRSTPENNTPHPPLRCRQLKTSECAATLSP